MDNPPACIAIIMDGNRRWAKARGLPTLEGHRRGYEKIKDVARWVGEAGIKHVALYALSTENLHRAQDEVAYLMDLAVEAAANDVAELAKENVRVRFAGKIELLPERVQNAVRKVQEDSKDNTGLTLWICLAYGGRAELVDAAQKCGTVTEESLAAHLWTAGMPEPDLILRPGGERRLSNFLLWQAAYSELFFIDTLWPDFGKAELDAVLAEYATRERRRGK